jgi:hypothetical protein
MNLGPIGKFPVLPIPAAEPVEAESDLRVQAK